MEHTCECGVEEGQLHVFGCHFELCPFCEGMFGSECECAYDFLGLRSRSNPPEQVWLSKPVYEGGLTPEQEQRWLEILSARGRLPFVSAPLMCGRCGRLWPGMFVVQDAAWEYYAGPTLRKAMLCEPCFHDLRQKIDKHQPRPAWVPCEEGIRRFIEAWKAGDRDTLRRLEPKKFAAHEPRARRLHDPHIRAVGPDDGP
jgi:hypothetical protein